MSLLLRGMGHSLRGWVKENPIPKMVKATRYAVNVTRAATDEKNIIGNRILNNEKEYEQFCKDAEENGLGVIKGYHFTPAHHGKAMMEQAKNNKGIIVSIKDRFFITHSLAYGKPFAGANGKIAELYLTKPLNYDDIFGTTFVWKSAAGEIFMRNMYDLNPNSNVTFKQTLGIFNTAFKESLNSDG